MPDWVGDSSCLQGPQRPHETTNYAYHKLTTTQRHQTLSYGLTVCNPKCKIQMPEDTWFKIVEWRVHRKEICSRDFAERSAVVENKELNHYIWLQDFEESKDWLHNTLPLFITNLSRWLFAPRERSRKLFSH